MTMTTTTNTRPRGVTALAILNFFFGACFAAGLFGYLRRLAYIPVESHSPLSQWEERQGVAIVHLGIAWYSLLAVGIGVTAMLLIVSGIGYLKLNRFHGRALGNIAVLLSIVAGLFAAFWLPPKVLDGGLTGFTAINFTYPLLTLFLLNVTFRKYFVN
jgi:hypothetical protein